MAPAHDDDPVGRAWTSFQQHRSNRVLDRDDVHRAHGARPHLYVPNELLVARDDLHLAEPHLRAIEAAEREVPGKLAEQLLRFELPRGEHVPTAIERMRASGRGRALRVSPHHVVAGLPNLWGEGGPGSFPIADDEQLEWSDGDGSGVRIAVLDTGYSRGIHPWLDAHAVAGPDANEELDVHPPNGWLDDESGHGTFIAGLVLERAPSATLEIAKVLDSDGYGQELAVAHAILEHADADVINLSLGCYSHDDLPPLALDEALRHVAPTTAVVAAAGNDGTHRPLWPAAHKRVIAVAAVGDDLTPAVFSNFGWWVDAAARGVSVLSAFLSFDEVGHAVPIAGRVPQDFRGWARWSGTSFATPKIAGEIAATMTREGLASAREAAGALLASNRVIRRDVGAVFDF